MEVLILEPYYSGSHKSWADNIAAHSQHNVTLLTMSGHHWKWRMHGGAVTLARQFMESDLKPDVILATDMLDLNLFLSLTRRRTAHIPTILYFHEDQLIYPWSPADKDKDKARDGHYSFINYASALTADHVVFNSMYHKSAFLNALPDFLNAFPDHNETGTLEEIKAKCTTLPLPLDLKELQALKPADIDRPQRAVVLWNHRWEYDKDPETFFNTLFRLQEHGVDFRLVILGERFDKAPQIFEKAMEELKDKILHVGYVESRSEYAYWLYLADILPVTSKHDFFGISVVEAMACDVIPLLPETLAYPEHIPETYKVSFFYEDAIDLEKKLQRRIFDVKVLRSQNVSHFVEQYDTSVVIKKYDSLFEAAVSEK